MRILPAFTFIIISVLWPLSSSQAYASSPVSCLLTAEQMQNVNLQDHVYHYWDPHERIKLPPLNQTAITPASLLAQLHKIQFEKAADSGNEVVLGKHDSNHWLTFCISNPTNQIHELVLATSPAVTAEIDFYPQKPGVKAFRTGNGLVMNTRDIFSPEFDFKIVLQANETQTFYMRIKTRTEAYLIASVWDEPSYDVAKDRREGIDGLIAGIILGLIAYTSLLYLSVRQSSSLLYIIWSISTLILFASIEGRTLQYLLPNNPVLANSITVLFYPLNVMISALFAREFIRLKDYPKLNFVGLLIIAVFTLVLIVAYFYGYAVYFALCGLFSLFVVSYFGLIAPIYAIIVNKSELARNLVIAHSPLIAYALDRNLFAIGLSTEYYIPYSAKVGLVVQMVLLAYFIGLTIYREKNEAQELALTQLKLSNELKTNYNAELQSELDRNTAEIRTMNADLEQQATQLRELDKVKSDFFANISHEFRTPLTLIEGPLNQLLEKENQPNKPIIQGAVRHSKELRKLIDQLLTLSEFDAQNLSLQASKLNLSSLTRLLVLQFSSLAESKSLTLNCDSTCSDALVYIDQDKFKIIINNLFSNAIKFTEQGGVINIDITSTAINSENSERSTDEYIQIVVSDTGYGIPSDELEHVFNRFFKSSSSVLAGTGVGTGIGLALVKELVLLHGGSINVTSVERSGENNDQSEGGTVFTLLFPLGRAHLRDNEISTHSIEQSIEQGIVATGQNAEAGDYYQQPKNIEETNAQSYNEPDSDIAVLTEIAKTETSSKVLIVDDNDDMRDYIRSILSFQYHIVEATDGLDAQDAVQKHTPDLIITDLMMPKRDGFEFVASLKKDNEFAKIPVIMLTARVGAEDRVKGFLAAVDDYLTKPFDARELKARVQNLLLRHAQFKSFYQIDDAASEAESEDPEAIYLAELRAVVNKNIADSSFGANEFAAQMFMSKATLQRRMAEKTKFTPSQFIRHCRLEKARQLSLSGNVRTLNELAHATGFNQVAYFARLYKRTFNTEPLVKKLSER